MGYLVAIILGVPVVLLLWARIENEELPYELVKDDRTIV